MRFAYLTPTSAIELSAPACREPGGGFDRCPRLRGHCRPQPGIARASLGAGAPALRLVAGTAGADHPSRPQRDPTRTDPGRHAVATSPGERRYPTTCTYVANRRSSPRSASGWMSLDIA